MSGDHANAGEGPLPDGREDDLERLFRTGHRNAVLAWVAVVPLALAVAVSWLDPDPHWLVFAACVAAVVLVPPVAYGEWHVMLPWELIAIATLPVLVRGLVGGPVGTFAAYLAVATLALLVTVELHMFTALEVTHWFAVTLVVLTTLASVAAWTVVRWYLDRLAGTAYLTTNEALMREWLWVAAAGLVAGVLFDVYFQRRDRELRAAIAAVVDR